MSRFAMMAIMQLCVAASALAQTPDHSSMPGMAMPDEAAKPAPKPIPAAPSGETPHKRKSATQHNATTGPSATSANQDTMPDMKAGPATPSNSHEMPGMQGAQTPSGSTPSDQDQGSKDGTMPGMKMSGTPSGEDMPDMQNETMAQESIPKTPPPPVPGDHAAEHYYDSAAMARARAELQREHGGGAVPYSKVWADLLEYQARPGADGYRWDGQAWFGGDIHRLVLRTEGIGVRGEGAQNGEVRALYSRAVGVYTDVQVGLRQDFDPAGRTYATAGFQSLFPYWFEGEAAVFLSPQGELLGRLEGSYDVRLTNRLILQPRAELNFAAQNTVATRTGSGLSAAELDLRLRYEIRREFAPYIGISYDRSFGRTADYARGVGEDVRVTSFVAGIRAFF